MAQSRIEDIIEEIEDFIEDCKPAKFSQSNIIVNRDELETLLDELRTKTPEEIKRYQKIISNREAILADARKQADDIIAKAEIQTNELVSEHQIMQQAYAKANEVVMIATKNAQEMLDKANEDANNIRLGAIEYTDNLLRTVQDVIVNSMETTRTRTDSYLSTMQTYLDEVVNNRVQLNPSAMIVETGTEVLEEEIPADIPVEPLPAVNETAPVENEKTEINGNDVDVTATIDIPDKFFNKD